MDDKIQSCRNPCFTIVFPSITKGEIIEHEVLSLMSKKVMLKFEMYDLVGDVHILWIQA